MRKTSFQKISAWLEDRCGLASSLRTLALHPIPPKTGWMYVFGSATLVALLVQIITGIALATQYVPSASQAYETLQYLTHYDAVGRLLRGMHYWGASSMVLLMGLHLTQVFLAGAYKFPREMNWISGVALLGLVLALAFTGQLMRWDNNAIWSVIVASEQAARIPGLGEWIARFLLGGNTLSASTLSRFFALHVFILPGLIFLLLSLHLYLVMRHGISEPPQKDHPVDPKTYRRWYQDYLKTHGEPFWPNAAWKDAVIGATLILAITLLAWFVGPPDLDAPPNPANLQTSPRPDWYFLWYFAVLALSPHHLENYLMVFAPALIGMSLLMLPLISNRGERHPLRRPWSVGIVILTYLSIGSFWILGYRSDWSPDFDTPPLPANLLAFDTENLLEGAQLFRERGCQYCHSIAGYGGKRGPDLSHIADRLTRPQLILRINNGGYNMPAYAATLSSEDLEKIADFLMSRTGKKNLIERDPG